MGWGLAALGLSESLLNVWSQRYQKVLAAPAPRKWALLIGINEYEHPVQWPALQGCLTDLELQKMLLIHRFGFQPQHILTLTNQAATRTAIEAAFVSHLIEQVSPEDVVVIHFSGYGGHISARTTAESSVLLHRAQDLLLPADAFLQPNGSDDRINGLLEDTLFLLLRSLPTDRVTTILDVGFDPSVGALGGGVQVRSQPLPAGLLLNEAELAFQAELLQQNALSAEQVSVQQRAGQLPGILLRATHAIEAHWHHTPAGLLTYWLTQRLWNTTPPTPTMVTFNRIATAVEQQVGSAHQPELQGQKSYETPLLGYGQPLSRSADGVILTHDAPNPMVQCWLGGLSPHLLQHALTLGFDSLVASGPVTSIAAMPSISTPPPPPSDTALPSTAASPPAEQEPIPKLAATRPTAWQRISDTATPPGNLPLSSSSPPETEGSTCPDDFPLETTTPFIVFKKPLELRVTGKLTQPAVEIPSPFLQEALRELPRSLTLQVALGTPLDRMERVDATSAFSSALDLATVPAEQAYADVLLSRVSTPTGSEADPESSGRYGLFHHGGELYANTLGEPKEAIKTAVRRLSPQIEVLLAAKALSLTVNDVTARVGVSVTLDQIKAEETQPLIHQFTTRVPWPCPAAHPTPKAETLGKIVTLAQGTHIQYRIQNYSPFPLYLLVLGIDPSPDQLWCYAPLLQPEASEPTFPKYAVIPPQETLTLPKATTERLVHGPPGLATTYFLLARHPWQQTLSTLTTHARQSSRSAAAFTLQDPWLVAQSVLADLHEASVAGSRAPNLVSDQGWLLDVQQWATLAFVHRVI